MNLEEILGIAKQQGCSDVHLTAGYPIIGRKNGRLFVLYESAPEPETLAKAVAGLLKAPQAAAFAAGKDVDAAYQDRFGQRYRINAYHAQGKPCAALRILSEKIPTLVNLFLPKAVSDLADLPRGLVLVTGPTGSGKSTTLAALIDHINQTRNAHIITVEDPVEYVFPARKCLIHQREVHADVPGFSEALRSALREDPDVIMVGEMRDRETIQMAITAAETGHLVLSTLHTNSAVSTIDRIIDVFPADQQAQVRSELTLVLRGVVTQQLVPLADGSGRRAALEVMIMNEAIANLIREDKSHQIAGMIQMSQGMGMQLLDQSLARLVQQGLVSADEALKVCRSVSQFRQFLVHG